MTGKCTGGKSLSLENLSSELAPLSLTWVSSRLWHGSAMFQESCSPAVKLRPLRAGPGDRKKAQHARSGENSCAG